MKAVLNCGSKPRQLAEILSRVQAPQRAKTQTKSYNERDVHGCQIETASKSSPPVRSATFRSMDQLGPWFSKIVPVEEKFATIISCLSTI